jgi:hypothetical protein
MRATTARSRDCRLKPGGWGEREFISFNGRQHDKTDKVFLDRKRNS